MSSTHPRAGLGERWLGLSRLVTFHALSRKMRQRSRRLSYEPAAGAMLYVAASSLPYHTSGYTTRTQAVIRALRDAGRTVHAVTRPGYPWDRQDRNCEPGGTETEVDDVAYRHLCSPSNRWPVILYAARAATVIAKFAARRRVAVIHAASNHVNALPALLAARRLGIPFQYEMRGLWELTRVSRMPEYRGSQGFRQGLELEGLVARQADRLLVISEQLGSFARETWGVPAERIALLPNCVDPARFAGENSPVVEPNTIGYAGSLISYEGLDTLIEAVAALTRKGVGLRVDIVGEGEARVQLENQVRRLGLSGRIRFAGRVPPESVQEILRRCALVCIPRKPFQVCEIVPPIKMVEALAMGKPVIVPDLPVFRDELGKDPAGWFFKAGDAADLARVIEQALADQRALADLGVRARQYAAERRCWRNFVINVLPAAQGEGLNGRPGH